jgi:2-hydroxycyclohexanecarboxyl-CoA dehydrogenase
MKNLIDLTDKTAIVIGGARGIGRATVAALADAGADVVIGDLREDAAERTAIEISEESRRRVVAVRTDVTNLDEVNHLRDQTLKLFGKIDVLVNSAGWDQLKPFVKTTPDLWERVIAINFKGVVHTCHAMLPVMSGSKSGHVINMSSDTARVGSFGEAIYAASKAGVIAFSKTLAREHARDNITVNVICPGLVDTPLIEEMRRDDFTRKILESIVNYIPFKRLGRPEEIAPMVAFLASDAATYITGQVFSINGGLNMVG